MSRGAAGVHCEPPAHLPLLQALLRLTRCLLTPRAASKTIPRGHMRRGPAHAGLQQPTGGGQRAEPKRSTRACPDRGFSRSGPKNRVSKSRNGVAEAVAAQGEEEPGAGPGKQRAAPPSLQSCLTKSSPEKPALPSGALKRWETQPQRAPLLPGSRLSPARPSAPGAPTPRAVLRGTRHHPGTRRPHALCFCLAPSNCEPSSKPEASGPSFLCRAACPGCVAGATAPPCGPSRRHLGHVSSPRTGAPLGSCC
ncbi:translation initiation factor IF-2-like [Choloepus didactylus]|uniref:translation initiation factor IF-2-like n=1 Tax=Choloepus didactylus TaxID=27675 RepID=UPI00189E017D|nr:translation initiation factor IF-2-like [Choloepus didactylus]